MNALGACVEFSFILIRNNKSYTLKTSGSDEAFWIGDEGRGAAGISTYSGDLEPWRILMNPK